MAITAINRAWTDDPSIVTIITTDNFATITANGYLTTQAVNIDALNKGKFDWHATDYCLISYSGGEGFFTVDFTANFTFIAAAAPGFLTDALTSAHIFVGNAGNIATDTAVTGDININNAGVTVIQAGVVTSTKIAAGGVATANIAAGAVTTATIANGAVTTVKIANNAVTSQQLALNIAQYAQVNVTSAQIKAAYGAPIQIVAPFGAHTIIIPTSVTFEFDYETTQYTAGGAMGLQYGNVPFLAGPPATGTVPGASIDGFTESSIFTLPVEVTVFSIDGVNTGLFLSNDTAAFATGDSTINVNIGYVVLTTTA